MPFPEPGSWDRKEIYRDRRHVKPEPFGSSPVASRWNRDLPSFSYHGYHHGSGPGEFSRGGFTDYPRPQGRARHQSDWQMFPEGMGYEYVPSKSCERVIEDRNYSTSYSSRVDGRFRSGTDCYKVKGYQKDWGGPNWQHNNSFAAGSAGKPFNGSPVFYGGKPCNTFSDMPVERRHNGMYPGVGTDRNFSASPVVCYGRPSNGFAGNGYPPRNGFSPMNTSDRAFSLSPAVSGDKPFLGYSNPHIGKSRDGLSGPSVVKTHSRTNQSFAAERPSSLQTSVTGERASAALSSPPVDKASNILSPHIAADRSNHVSPDIPRPCYAPINAVIVKTGEHCSDVHTEKTVDGCSFSASAERTIKLSSGISKDMPNPVVSRAPIEKTPFNITSSLADGDISYVKPSCTPVTNVCNGISVEKPGNRVACGSSANICDGIARSTVTDQPEVKIDEKISNNEHASECLRMVSKNPSKQDHDVEVGKIFKSCDVPKHEKESFREADWKPLIWTRSGSLSSRGQSSSSRSLPVDLKATVDESLQFKGAALSPTGDAADCLTSSATSREAPALKKARLGWGQGLAKYEKKIVEDPCGCEKQDNVCSPKVGDKCTSPSFPTSASATCSSLQDNEFKSLKEANTPDSLKLGVSDNVPSSFEKVDMSIIKNEVYLLLNRMHSEDQCPTGSGLDSTNSMSKLLLWKTGILKAVEITDSEIESLDSKIQSSTSENRSHVHCPAASSSLDANGETKSNKTITACSVLPILLPVDSSEVRDEIDSPGTATSNPVVASHQVKATPQAGNSCLFPEDVSTNISHTLVNFTHYRETCHPDVDTPTHFIDDPSRPNHDMLELEEIRLQKLIFAANREDASKAYDELEHLFSKNGTSDAFCQESNSDMLIRDEVAKRKKLLKFTEKVVTLKYRALQQLWKEDAWLLEIRKNRPKSSRQLDLGTKTSQYAHSKSNLLRSRASSTDGNTRLVPSTQTICLTSKLLSDCPVKSYKDELKMPSLILDEKEKRLSRFISYNGLVEDPVAVEKERSVMNPWTADEKETFVDKFAIFGKDFRKIASYLDHKTTADCVEFYYKNHKSSLFGRTRKKSARLVGTQNKSVAKRAYMLTSGVKWEQERVAADVLTGRSGSFSSEGISPCVSSSFNHADVHRQWKRKKVGGKRKRTWTHEVPPINDETCSGESSGEMNFSTVDWTDEEKHLLLQAVKLYGNNFELVSKFVKTRYSSECKVFYSKVKKRLGSTPAAANINNEGIVIDTKPDIDVRLSTRLLEHVL